jgi:hypothetical protein
MDYKNSIQTNKLFPISEEIKRRNQFSRREVGFNHPDNSSFIRLNDDGDIEIFAAPGIGIIISATGKSISFFAEKIRMFCSEEGLRWNNFNFNYSASDYSQPTLVKIDPKSIHSAQNAAFHYLAKLKTLEQTETQKTITIEGDYGFGAQEAQVEQSYSSLVPLNGLTEEQKMLVVNILSEHSREYVEYLVDLMKQGHTFAQAREKANKNKNV